ncbi:PD40 domain-containing protein [Chroococcus sp. FPU101]|uniref:TolB family protein n=1 Tax=Chroococcus sp. FPU101 TaxID=1974212 RepID=UPI001A8DFE7E|nr:PD40 domain-containing protein [Chroococcus sp. FPU101]GFE71558.1 WD40 domain protein beta Propeller [Chroococcus sp. FPU101]
MKRFIFASLIVSSLLGSCTGYPRLLNLTGLNSSYLEASPQISSRFIVFTSDRNGSQDVYLFDTQIRRFVNNPGLNSLDEIASHPSITEDGKYIVFAGSRQGRTNIYIYNRETQQKRNLTSNLQADVRNPSISADGSRVVFEVAKNGQWDLAVYDIAESRLTE